MHAAIPQSVFQIVNNFRRWLGFGLPPRVFSSLTGVIPVVVLFSLLPWPLAGALPTAVLAMNGEARMPIIVGENAAATVQTAAAELADYLQRMTGAEFTVKTGEGRQGLVLGEVDDFSDLPFEIAFGSGSFERDHYLLRTTAEDGLFLLGATPLAVRFAVWDLLQRFGYRYYFPSETWEIVPIRQSLQIAIDDYQQPDYYNRSGPRSHPRGSRHPWAQEPWRNWQIRNRTTSSFQLSTGHAYQNVIRANRQAFNDNPEYYGLVGGERSRRAQPNIAHPEVQRMFIEYALDYFRRNPDRDSIALDPMDHNPWSESEESLRIGRPSEQAVFIANLVAEAIVEEFGEDKYVGIYGYDHHSPPPRIDVHPNVIVSLATSFIRGGYTFEGLLDGWSERASMLGIREYYGLTIWHQSKPGQGNASDLGRLASLIPHWHQRGARFMNAESDLNWGGNGLGNYLSSRFLWDISEADRMDELVEDFLVNCFGSAIEPMRQFYRVIDRDFRDPYVPHRRQPLNDDRIGRMYRSLGEAFRLARSQPAALARIEDLILYTRYVDLFRQLERAPAGERQEAFDRFATYAWRIRERNLAASINMLAHLNRFFVNRHDDLEWPEGGGSLSPADIYRENENVPHTRQEIVEILRDGIARHQILELDFVPVDYDDDVLLPVGLQSDARRGGPADLHFAEGNRGNLHFYIGTHDRQLPTMYFSAGHVYNDRGPLRVELFDSHGESLQMIEVAPGARRRSRADWHEQEATRKLELTVPRPGLYRLHVSNTGQGFFWDYEPRPQSMLTVRADSMRPVSRNWLRIKYFYVPSGTREIVLFGALRQWYSEGGWQPAADEYIAWDEVEIRHGFSIVPVPEGRDGKIWAFRTRHSNPELRFLNIPGYLAFHPSELMLPRKYAEEIKRLGDSAGF